MIINEEVYGQLTAERAREIIDEIIQKEAQGEPDSLRA
jgi:NADH:ubiquinone oxidoreductase subunit E